MRKILIIATVILLAILLTIFLLTAVKKKTDTANNVSPTPTTVPIKPGSVNPPTSNSSTLLESAKSMAPYENESFRYEYSPQLNKIVVTEKTENGMEQFLSWAQDNGLKEIGSNPDMVIYQLEGQTGTVPVTGTERQPNSGKFNYLRPAEPIIDFMNIFLNYGTGSETPASGTTPAPKESSGNPGKKSNSSQSFNYTYYAQCNGYGNTPLPGGCDLCDAGCGPTTVSMIAASYLGKEYNPKTIVDLYEKKGYYLSCAGSRYTDAKAALEGLGLKTTSYMTYDFDKADAVAADFKKYIDSGWTIFTLANYCDEGCGHYFWVTDVQDGKILAYDPYYGQSTSPPYNENSRYPFPKYRVAFGVKK